MEFVKIYTADWCFDCKTVISYLEKNNVAYQLIDVDKDQNAVKNLQKICGGKKIIPTLDFHGRYLINPTIQEVSEILSNP